MTIWSKNGRCTWSGARIAFAFLSKDGQYSVLPSVSPISIEYSKQYHKINIIGMRSFAGNMCSYYYGSSMHSLSLFRLDPWFYSDS